jgi:hypothetical protein
MSHCTIDWTALGTWAIAFLTLLTLIKVAQYVTATNKLVRLSQQQNESSIAPFIALMRPEGRGDQLINQGKGPAINIRYVLHGKSMAPKDPISSSLSPGDFVEISSLSQHYNGWDYKQGLEVVYESLTHTVYFTNYRWDHDAEKLIATYRQWNESDNPYVRL